MDYSVSISVVMPTYNTETQMLRESVESILNQTFHDFEFLIIDDGSTNDSVEYLKSIQDERVKIIRNAQNIGVTKALNVGLKQAKGKYIARMDADDVSLPARFEKEFAFMEEHPDVIVCGAIAGILDAENNVHPVATELPKDMDEYRVLLLFSNPGPSHPSAFFRRESLLTHHILYDENLVYAQDYGLWETLSHYGKIVTLDEMLIYRRKHRNQITVAKHEIQSKCNKMTQKKILSALLGSVTDAEVDLHYIHSTGYFQDATISPEVAKWYDRLLQANQSRRIYDQKKLEKRIIILKKSLIRHTLKPEMSGFQRLRMVFQYLPFLSGIRMIAGNIKRKGAPV